MEVCEQKHLGCESGNTGLPDVYEVFSTAYGNEEVSRGEQKCFEDLICFGIFDCGVYIFMRTTPFMLFSVTYTICEGCKLDA